MTATTQTPVDQPARERIRAGTDATLFVNAGAGSGKTSALVERVVHLVVDDGIPLRCIAAVTFTERAGAELRDRLRVTFEGLRGGDAGPLADAALDDLDGAAIGTLHSFAQRLLGEHPVEAGLPPVIEVLDEIASSVAFDERWLQVQQALLDDEGMAQPLLIGLAVGMTLKQVRSLAVALGNDWDLIADRVLSTEPPRLRLPDLEPLRRKAGHVVALAEHCTDADDKLLPRLHELEAVVDRLDTAVDDESRIAAVAELKALRFGRIGQKGNWGCDIREVREGGAEVTALAAAVVDDVLDACLRQITAWLARRVLDAAEVRRREGRLEFHDLLVLARDLLRRNAEVRAAAHDDYQRLLLDEFQDTDPIQIELAVRIAGGADAGQESWQDVHVLEGRIFVVGDAKQSIYRFRRASIATYLQAQERIGEPLSLTTNFRSVAPVLGWVNAVFGTLVQHEAGAQPAYEALSPYRQGAGYGAAVTVLGARPHEDLPRASADVLREREARDVAAVIGQMIDEGWQVCDRRDGGWRPVRHEDVAVLVPARTSLPALEDALEEAAVPYRSEASSLVYQAPEVRDLLTCARALADATDELSLVATLRSPLFGCGDDDLWRWKQAGGRFSVYSELDRANPLAAGPVGTALTELRHLAHASRWLSPSELLGRVVADRRMLEVAATGPRARDAWRRLRFVVDQARAWAEVSHGGLRAYLAWAAHQGQEASRVAESVLPETDAHAVRIMTVHAAKGLEFPVVVLSGMTSRTSSPKGVRLLWPAAGGYQVKLASGVQTEEFEAAVPLDEQMDDREKVRLLYVAATRARDHLVVSLHRDAGSTTSSSARRLAEAGAATAAGAVTFTAPERPPSTLPAEPAPEPPPAYDEWWRGVQAARERSRTPGAVSASGLEGTEPVVVLTDDTDAGQAKGPRDLELPPWSKGRYGSDVGRAVHAVLQEVDLDDGTGLDEAVAAQCVSEGVVGHETLVRDLARSALDSELVRRAAEREHWREVYVGTVDGAATDGAQVLEGYVDLLFRDDDGTLVVVDYKTDAVPAQAIRSRVDYYRPQMDAYGRCLAAATGATVRTVLLFLHPEGSVAVPLT